MQCILADGEGGILNVACWFQRSELFNDFSCCKNGVFGSFLTTSTFQFACEKATDSTDLWHITCGQIINRKASWSPCRTTPSISKYTSYKLQNLSWRKPHGTLLQYSAHCVNVSRWEARDMGAYSCFITTVFSQYFITVAISHTSLMSWYL